jgi:hypothetical protein
LVWKNSNRGIWRTEWLACDPGRVRGTSGRLEGLISISRLRGKIADGERLWPASLNFEKLVWLGTVARSAESVFSRAAFGTGLGYKVYGGGVLKVGSGIPFRTEAAAPDRVLPLLAVECVRENACAW